MVGFVVEGHILFDTSCYLLHVFTVFSMHDLQFMICMGGNAGMNVVKITNRKSYNYSHDQNTYLDNKHIV